MKSFSLQLLFFIFSSCLTLAFVQSGFKDKNLQLLEEIVTVSQNDLKSFMQKKEFSFKNSSDQSIINSSI